ncbi:hypothetical protein DFP72DRAFT_857948 [Ephemerocybe angulata]|uniref:Uncharacterized protein n=1 Tax=Ephemerocybe angulata TaxID=980116 RepID=A0A8H6HDF2_9AGAR|nr:hypothetical protein DFP72DRAFT_857948 [Tulosesus angulatus]
MSRQPLVVSDMPGLRDACTQIKALILSGTIPPDDRVWAVTSTTAVWRFLNASSILPGLWIQLTGREVYEFAKVIGRRGRSWTETPPETWDFSFLNAPPFHAPAEEVPDTSLNPEGRAKEIPPKEAVRLKPSSETRGAHHVLKLKIGPPKKKAFASSASGSKPSTISNPQRPNPNPGRGHNMAAPGMPMPKFDSKRKYLGSDEEIGDSSKGGSVGTSQGSNAKRRRGTQPATSTSRTGTSHGSPASLPPSTAQVSSSESDRSPPNSRINNAIVIITTPKKPRRNPSDEMDVDTSHPPPLPSRGRQQSHSRPSLPRDVDLRRGRSRGMTGSPPLPPPRQNLSQATNHLPRPSPPRSQSPQTRGRRGRSRSMASTVNPSDDDYNSDIVEISKPPTPIPAKAKANDGDGGDLKKTRGMKARLPLPPGQALSVTGDLRCQTCINTEEPECVVPLPNFRGARKSCDKCYVSKSSCKRPDLKPEDVSGQNDAGANVAPRGPNKAGGGAKRDGAKAGGVKAGAAGATKPVGAKKGEGAKAGTPMAVGGAKGNGAKASGSKAGGGNGDGAKAGGSKAGGGKGDGAKAGGSKVVGGKGNGAKAVAMEGVEGVSGLGQPAEVMQEEGMVEGDVTAIAQAPGRPPNRREMTSSALLLEPPRSHPTTRSSSRAQSLLTGAEEADESTLEVCIVILPPEIPCLYERAGVLKFPQKGQMIYMSKKPARRVEPGTEEVVTHLGKDSLTLGNMVTRVGDLEVLVRQMGSQIAAGRHMGSSSVAGSGNGLENAADPMKADVADLRQEVDDLKVAIEESITKADFEATCVPIINMTTEPTVMRLARLVLEHEALTRDVENASTSNVADLNDLARRISSLENKGAGDDGRRAWAMAKQEMDEMKAQVSSLSKDVSALKDQLSAAQNQIEVSKEVSKQLVAMFFQPSMSHGAPTTVPPRSIHNPSTFGTSGTIPPLFLDSSSNSENLHQTRQSHQIYNPSTTGANQSNNSNGNDIEFDLGDFGGYDQSAQSPSNMGFGSSTLAFPISVSREAAGPSSSHSLSTNLSMSGGGTAISSSSPHVLHLGPILRQTLQGQNFSSFQCRDRAELPSSSSHVPYFASFQCRDRAELPSSSSHGLHLPFFYHQDGRAQARTSFTFQARARTLFAWASSRARARTSFTLSSSSHVVHLGFIPSSSSHVVHLGFIPSSSSYVLYLELELARRSPGLHPELELVRRSPGLHPELELLELARRSPGLHPELELLELARRSPGLHPELELLELARRSPGLHPELELLELARRSPGLHPELELVRRSPGLHPELELVRPSPGPIPRQSSRPSSSSYVLHLPGSSSLAELKLARPSPGPIPRQSSYVLYSPPLSAGIELTGRAQARTSFTCPSITRTAELELAQASPAPLYLEVELARRSPLLLWRGLSLMAEVELMSSTSHVFDVPSPEHTSSTSLSLQSTSVDSVIPSIPTRFLAARRHRPHAFHPPFQQPFSRPQRRFLLKALIPAVIGRTLSSWRSDSHVGGRA